MTLPRHPGENDEIVSEPGPSGRTKAIVALVALVLVVVIVLHLTGVVGGG
jgi:hypothetical protein